MVLAKTRMELEDWLLFLEGDVSGNILFLIQKLYFLFAPIINTVKNRVKLKMPPHSVASSAWNMLPSP
jgi:hypothetical protein